MAKFNNEQFFIINPLSLVKREQPPLTFAVYLYLKLNARIIALKKIGATIEGPDELEAMMKRGLVHLHVLKTEMQAYLDWVKGTEFETTAEDLLAIADKAARGEPVDEKALAPKKHDVQLENIEQTGRNQRLAEAAAKARPEEAKPEEAKPEEAEPKPAPTELEALVPTENPVDYVPETRPEEIMAGLLKPAPENLPAMDQAKEMVKTILKSSPAGAAVADIVENPDTEHATTVAVYTALFAMGLKRTEQSLLQDLIIASLLHDIGLTQVAADIVPIPAQKQSGPQKAAFEQHVELGVALLGELDYAPNKRVLALMQQHHEKFNGSGYPLHLESFRIDELAQIVSLADVIDSAARGTLDGTKRPLGDAILYVAQLEKQTTFPVFFNPDVFKKVMNWLKKGGGQDYIAAAEAAVNETKQKLLKAG